MNTLEKRSGILIEKSKFFITRLLIYFSFIFIPLWLTKINNLHILIQLFMLILYTLFMVGQWFALGKEIDHRLKIYYKVNSSIDRVLYRIILGKLSLLIVFNFFNLIPDIHQMTVFWAIWISLGFFYSWPTRGKIIRETVSSELTEFRYLDAFEKTILFLICVIFFISIPEIPQLENIESLKLFFDPDDLLSYQFWNFLKTTYLPFQQYPQFMKLAWCLHYYCIGLGLFLLCFYALLRFFFSRRVAILGVFSVISSWSYSKILVVGLGLTFPTSYSLLWIWGILWVAKSSTYRTGLFLGLLIYWGTINNRYNFYLFPISFFILYFYFLKDKSVWFLKQLFKYMALGFILSFVSFFINSESFFINDINIETQIMAYFKRKAFFGLSILGILFLIAKYLNLLKKIIPSTMKILNKDLKFVLALILFSYIWGKYVDNYFFSYFAILWPLALLSLIPVEYIFQSISRLRLKRNIIFAIYVLICLFDSHLEGRVKILLRIFDI